jgi:hypothetical protein
MDEYLKENKTSVLNSPSRPSILNSPVKLPAILASRRSRSEIPEFSLDSPGRNNQRKVTSFAKVEPLKMSFNKSLSILKESEEISYKPPTRKMTFHSSTEKFTNLPLRKLTSRGPLRKNTGNDLYRSQTIKLDILNNTNVESLRMNRKKSIDQIHQKIRYMSNAKTDMKVIHMKSVFSNIQVEKSEDSIRIEKQEEIVNKSPIKSLRTFKHKNTYLVRKINKKEKIDQKSINFKFTPVMQKRKKEILKIAGQEFKTFLNKQKEIATFINERLKVINEFNFDDEHFEN